MVYPVAIFAHGTPDGVVEYLSLWTVPLGGLYCVIIIVTISDEIIDSYNKRSGSTDVPHAQEELGPNVSLVTREVSKAAGWGLFATLSFYGLNSVYFVIASSCWKCDALKATDDYMLLFAALSVFFIAKRILRARS